jgi:DNA-binding IclR family transcriptional regulator
MMAQTSHTVRRASHSMRNQGTESRNTQDSGLGRVLRLFAAFEAADPDVSVAELAAATDLPISTVYRYVAELRGSGYVQVGVTSGTYRLGPRVLALARHYHASDNLGDIAKPHLESLRDQSGETALLLVPSGLTAVCVDQVPSLSPVKLIIEKGRVMPLHAGGDARALLAFMPGPSIDKVIAAGLPRYTESTLDTPDKLLRALEATRQRGYACSDGEMDPGVRSIAVPVLCDGEAIASLAVCGPSHRFTSEQAMNVVPHLQEAAGSIAYRLKKSNARPSPREPRDSPWTSELSRQPTSVRGV